MRNVNPYYFHPSYLQLNRKSVWRWSWSWSVWSSCVCNVCSPSLSILQVVVLTAYLHDCTLYSSVVYPTSYTIHNTHLQGVYGSSLTGHCPNSTYVYGIDSHSTCSDPRVSVLFDGNTNISDIRLDSDTWASQLLTLTSETSKTVSITFDFTDTPGYAGVGRVEVVMFHCPSWDIDFAGFNVYGESNTTTIRESLGQKLNRVLPISCHSLQRICLTLPPRSAELPLLTMEFIRSSYFWAFLAEITFWSCLPDSLITPAS